MTPSARGETGPHIPLPSGDNTCNNTCNTCNTCNNTCNPMNTPSLASVARALAHYAPELPTARLDVAVGHIRHGRTAEGVAAALEGVALALTDAAEHIRHGRGRRGAEALSSCASTLALLAVTAQGLPAGQGEGGASPEEGATPRTGDR